MREQPLVNSVPPHGARRFPVPRWTSLRSMWPERRISLASTAANRTSKSPDEQWRTLGGSGYGVARQLAGFRSERIHMTRGESSPLKARRLGARKLFETSTDNSLAQNFLAYLPSCGGRRCCRKNSYNPEPAASFSLVMLASCWSIARCVSFWKSPSIRESDRAPGRPSWTRSSSPGLKRVRSLSLADLWAVLWFRDQGERHCFWSTGHHQTASRV